jgi:hypothetical protein
MRTTLTLADDVAAAVDQLRRERGVGVSEAVNELVRRGLVSGRAPGPFEQKTHRMRARVDVTNVWEAIETVEGPAAR